MRLLPEKQRAESMLAISDPCRRPQRATNTSGLPAERSWSTLTAAGLSVPPVTAELINKVVTNLRHLALMQRDRSELGFHG
jgi:fatty acid CoA ligase FadD9